MKRNLHSRIKKPLSLPVRVNVNDLQTEIFSLYFKKDYDKAARQLRHDYDITSSPSAILSIHIIHNIMPVKFCKRWLPLLLGTRRLLERMNDA